MGREGISVSQDAFDALVRENQEEFDMDTLEAIADALETFKIQGADLSAVDTRPLAERTATPAAEHPLSMTLRMLNATLMSLERTGLSLGSLCAPFPGTTCESVTEEGQEGDEEQQEDKENRVTGGGSAGVPSGSKDQPQRLTELTKALALQLDQLRSECDKVEDMETAVKARAIRSLDLVNALTRACMAGKLTGDRLALMSALKALTAILRGVKERDVFYEAGGAKSLISCIGENTAVEDAAVSECGLLAVAGAATKQEAAKEHFMDLGVHSLCVSSIERHVASPGAIIAACDAMRALVTADDARAPSSKAFSNGRSLAKAGAVEALLVASRKHLPPSSLSSSSSSSLSSSAPVPEEHDNQLLLSTLCSTLKAVAVNDEICKSVAEHGGISLLLQLADHCSHHASRANARATCALLCQLAGSDSNKAAIAEEGGIERLVRLCSVYAVDSNIVQEALAGLAALTLRSPSNAASAMSAGAADVAVEAMPAHPQALGVQRHACSLIRNLVVRNPEHRPLILEKGAESYIRRAKTLGKECRDTACAALRDLGFDDYNS